VAVNVTLVPAQIALSASLEAMLTLAAKLGFTVAVIESLDADKQPDVVFLDCA